MSASTHRLLLMSLLMSACHVARITPPQPTCHDNAVVSCQACADRGCTWCPQGPSPSDGYCCDTAGRCPNPIRHAPECAVIEDCDHAAIGTCGACVEHNCAWCPGEARCHARGSDGTFPSCSGRIAGEMSCPTTNVPGDIP